MSGIYIMLAITAALSLLFYGGYLMAISRGKWKYLILVLVGLPLSAVVNLLIKGPFVQFLERATGYPPAFAVGVPVFMLILLMLTAPVTEEAIKVSPLLLPPLRRMVDGKLSGLLAGFALGIGFGIGEAAYLAYQVSRIPQAQGLSWFMFGNFGLERLLATLAHGVMTAVFASALAQGWRRGWLGYLAAIGLHSLLNSGAALLQIGLLDALTVFIQLVVNVILLLVLFEILRRKYAREERSFDSEPTPLV